MAVWRALHIYGVNEYVWHEHLDCEKDKDNTLDAATGARSIYGPAIARIDRASTFANGEPHA